MAKYKLTFYRTTSQQAEKTVEANNYEEAGEMASRLLYDIGGLDWTDGAVEAEFDVDEEVNDNDSKE